MRNILPLATYQSRHYPPIYLEVHYAIVKYLKYSRTPSAIMYLEIETELLQILNKSNYLLNKNHI